LGLLVNDEINVLHEGLLPAAGVLESGPGILRRLPATRRKTERLLGMKPLEKNSECGCSNSEAAGGESGPRCDGTDRVTRLTKALHTVLSKADSVYVTHT
jgi:hypothetical protein